MSTILIATEKPFAPEAVDLIRSVVENAGHTLSLLENYTDNKELLDAVANAHALIVRSDLAPGPNCAVRNSASSGMETSADTWR